MSGPALKQRNAHQAIHNAALYEAEEITAVVRHLLTNGHRDKAASAAQLLIEHWQTRTLRHAEEEEAGLYAEILSAQPNRAADIAALKRDHDLMRQLVAEAQVQLKTDGDLATLLARCEMLLWLVEEHSREEERRLL